MTVDIILTVVGALLMLVGVVGCFVPVLPGPPISYIGLIVVQFRSDHPFTVGFLIVTAIAMIVVTVLDYIVPIWGTKKMGGTKKGMWGATIGLFCAIFISWIPFSIFVSIIVLPFGGAVIGELIAKQPFGKALKAGLGSFLGLLAGTLMKLAVSVWFAVKFSFELLNFL